MTKTSQPYTYLIGWTNVIKPKFYYGRLTSKKANPTKFWTGINGYYTTSKIVPDFHKLHGEPDIIWVYSHKTRKIAIEDENNFLAGILKSDRHSWLNQKFGASWGMAGKKQSEEHKRKKVMATKGKTYEEIYGVEKATKLRKIHSKIKKGNTNAKGKIFGPQSKEHRQKRSKSMLGKNKDRKLGPQQIIKCPDCGESGGVSNMKRWHFDNCRYTL